MLKDITLGQYFPGNSFVHKMDAMIKLIITFAYLILIFMVQNFYGYAVIAVFVSIVILISKVPVKFVIKGLRPILIFIIFTAFLNLFMTGGEQVIWQWRFLRLTREGISYCVSMILRIVFLVTGTSMLTYVTSPIALTDGIERLLKPLEKLGFPTHELAMMMSIALRFIPVLLEETDKIMKAQTARGADFETGSLVRRAKALIPLLVPLFISAFRRADELAVAMECRCYRGGAGRTRLHKAKIGLRDCAACVIMGLFMVGLIILNRV